MDGEIRHRISGYGHFDYFRNGAVANVELKGTKGHQSGWLVIAVGYGISVMDSCFDVWKCFRKPY